MYELRGQVCTLPAPAAAVAEVSGRPVTYRQVPAADLGPGAFMYDLIASGLVAEGSDDLGKLAGHPPVSLSAAVTAALR